METVVIFGLINFISATLSGAAGGGGALIMTSSLVLLGLTPAQAIATAKFSGFGISLGASSRFYREKLTDKRTLILYSGIAVMGAVLGSLTLVHFQEHGELLENIMGFAILAIGIPTLYMRGSKLSVRPRSAWLQGVGYFLIFIVAILQAALSSGIGSLTMITLMAIFGMTPLVASATRRVMQLAVAVVSLSIFMAVGLVDYRFGLVGLFTALLGGYIGAHVAVKRGDKFVRDLFAIVAAAMALVLIFG